MFRIVATARATTASLRPLCSKAGRSALTSLFHSNAALLADFTVVVPHMSESISEGIVSNLPVPIGSPVAVDQVVCELETDKVTFQVRSTQSGVMKSIVVAQGDTVPVGAPLLILDTDGKAAAAPAPSAPQPQQQAPPQAPPAPAASSAGAPSTSSSSHGHGGSRVPSIRFRYGKREDAPHSSAPSSSSSSQHAAAAQKPAGSKAPAGAVIPGYTGGNYNDFLAKIAPSKAMNGRSYLDLPPAFGRPPLSPKEIAAIESGGAY